VSASNSSDEPIENPYEASVSADTDEIRVDSYGRSESEERRAQMPPIQRSYWVGIAVLIVLGLVSFSSGSFPPEFPFFWGSFNYSLYHHTVSIGTWMSFCIPFALVRLVWHRWNIAKAIEFERYPGTQRFGLWYLFWSIFLSWLCIIAGGVLFFGICTVIFISTNSQGSLRDFAGVALIGDGFLSLLFAGFLFTRTIPRYR
jgi:hypothetical protein